MCGRGIGFAGWRESDTWREIQRWHEIEGW
jgi:hypothetical protein